ncbi:MAG: hypothetical protein KKG99_01085 [Bacteroidetes bacterium]|nr:hypothetical protein [Bacteroidota bacterium]
MKKTILIAYLLLVAAITINAQQTDFPYRKLSGLTGPYFGQKPPGMIPEIFAPGIVSTMYHEHSAPSFSPSGKEVFWLSYPQGNYIYRYPKRILYSKEENGCWSIPEFPSFAIGLECSEAFFSYDGEKAFFSAAKRITIDGEDIIDNDIWITEKTSSDWLDPVNIGDPISSNNFEYQPTVTEDLTLYYMGYLEGVKNNYGIFRSKFLDGKYMKPEALPAPINSEAVDWTPFIARDESYLLWSSTREGGYGNGDIYVSFKDENNNWTAAINLGSNINEKFNERYPSISPDGKYLFFVSDKINERLEEETDLTFQETLNIYNNPGNGWSDVYWVDAKIIEELKKTELQGN